MFSSSEEPSSPHARAAGRIGFGVVAILGAATFVERVVRMDHPEAAKTLATIWLVALFSGWLVAKLASVTAQRTGIADIFTLSYVVPTIGVALLIPLTLHIPAALALNGDLAGFDRWAKLGLAITGPAHVAFALLAALRAARLAQGRPAMSSTRIYVAVVTVSAIPFALLLMLPPLLVGLTGMFLIPLMQRMRTMIELERGVRAELPKAVVLA